jgi:hypothetical protein
VAALRRHPVLSALLVVYLLGAGIALWLAPLLGGIMLAALAVVGSLVLLPSLLNIGLHGPGYQYRDESSPIVRRKRRGG